MPDLTTLPIDALTVLPDGTVWARDVDALRSVPSDTVIRDASNRVGVVWGGTVSTAGDEGDMQLDRLAFDPVLGVEVIAGPRKRALS